MLNLEKDEKIILEVRKHWFIFIGNILGLFFGVALPIIAYFLALNFAPDEVLKIILNYKAISLYVYSVWVLILWVSFFIQWTNYYLDVWFVTEKRIIDIDQKGIFHRDISNLRFDKIQDVTVEVNGFIATLLNFGDIHVQTAAEDSSEFSMKGAKNPEHVKKIIFAQHNKEAENK